jgi:hypothetical protein
MHNLYLHARDRGCTKPGCDAPAYHNQVHHVRGWAGTRRTDINELALACGPDNRLVEKGWKTRKNANGDTEWIPPPHNVWGQSCRSLDARFAVLDRRGLNSPSDQAVQT